MSQPKFHSARRISRRAVLRGAGVTMALPWLPSLSAFADTASPAVFRALRRSLHGHGVNEEQWSAEGSGAEMKLQQDSVRDGAV